MLRSLYERCLNGEDTPEEWRTAHITPIHKKGARNDPRNYRGIAVISTIGRIYSKILKTLIEENIADKQAEEQSGFRAGRSTIDNIFTLKLLMEKRLQRDRETHLALIDLEKAYDSVPVEQLWKEMKACDINQTLLDATIKLYEGNTARVKIGNKLTDVFLVTKGLRQGCGLSPTLFKIYLNRTLVSWQKKCRNMGIHVGEDILYTLYFADDQVVIAEDIEDLSYMVRKLQEAYELAGLQINMKKSEYLIVGSKDIKDLPLENGTITGVEKVKYLGVIFNKNGSSHEEITSRINKGRAVTRSINSILWDGKLRSSTKRKIYNSIVQSVTIYGAEAWDVGTRDRNKLLATEMDFLRRCCGKTRMDRVRNTDIREMMGVEADIVDAIQKRQLVWFGHTNRMEDVRWPKKILKWTPPERRKRGRPRRSWRSDVNEAMDARNLKEEDCQNKKDWKLGTEKQRKL